MRILEHHLDPLSGHTFDVLEAWEGLEATNKKVEAFKREARVLGGAHHLVADRRTP